MLLHSADRKDGRPWTLSAAGLLLLTLLHCDRIAVSVQSPPKIVNENPDSILSINVSSSLSLTCEGAQEVVWKSHGRKDISSRTMQKSTLIENVPNPYRTTLMVSDTVYSDTGPFICFYKDSLDSDSPGIKSEVYVFVNDPKHLFVPVDSKVIPIQQSLQSVIPCLPTSRDVKVSLWKGSQEVVVNNINVDYDATKGFLISYATVEFTGNFFCRAQLADVTEKIDFYFHWFPSTNVVPTPVINQISKYATPNSDFWLICTARAPADIFLALKWEYPNAESLRIREGGEYSSDVRLSNGEIYKETKRNLTISSFSKEDEGMYTCTVRDHTGKSNKKETFVEVRDIEDAFINFSIGQDINPSEPFEIPLGSPEMKFIVTVESFPPSPQLTWYKGPTPLANSTKYQIIHLDKSSMLVIRDLKSEDSNFYTLIGSVEGITRELELTLWVAAIPEITFIDKPRLYYASQYFNITCQIEGCPPSEIEWEWSPCDASEYCTRNYTVLDAKDKKDNEEKMLEFGEFSNGCHLTNIVSGKASVPGYYRCSAKNHYGDRSAEMPLFMADYREKFKAVATDTSPFEQDSLTLFCHASIFYYSKMEWSWSPEISSVHPSPITNSSNTLVILGRTRYSLIANVSINPAVMNNTGTFVCRAQTRNQPGNPWEEDSIYVGVKQTYPPTLLETNLNSSTYTVYKEDNFEFICRATGNPKPSISWFLNGTLIQSANDSARQIEDYGSKLIISRVLPSDSGYYVCQVANRVGVLVQNATLIVLDVARGEGLSVGGIAAVAIVVLLFFVAAIIFGIALGRRLCKEKKEKRELKKLQHMLFEQGDIGSYNPALPLEEQVDALPYDKQWEFPKEKLKLGRVLGQGAFGKVVRAEAIGILAGEESTTVAVKMLKERADWEQRKALMQELKILIHLGSHLNVVNLLGAVTQNLAKGELQVIVEYCRFGNLRHYLLRHRDTFINQVNPSTGEIDPSFKQRPSESTFFRAFSRTSEQMSSSISGNNSCIASDGLPPNSPTSPTFDSVGSLDNPRMSASTAKATAAQTLTTYHLVRHAYQICCGMQYLVSKKLVHRDLALRNILLAEDDIVKICDFGLSKDVYKKDYYRKKGKGPLPVKWMAIESIRDRVFSSESDVWAFGILLWEIFTMGGNPYPGMEVDAEFYKKLCMGYRMEKPELCTNSAYELMKECWLHEPRTRPKFDDISTTLGQLLDTNTIQHYKQLNDDYLTPKNFAGNPYYLNMLPQDEYISLESEPRTTHLQPDYMNCDSPHITMNPQSEAVNYMNVTSPRERTNSNPKTFVYGDVASNNHEVEPMLGNSPNGHYLEPPIPILVPQPSSTNPFSSVNASPAIATNPFLTPEATPGYNGYASSGYLDMGSKLSLDTDVDLRTPKRPDTRNSPPPSNAVR